MIEGLLKRIYDRLVLIHTKLSDLAISNTETEDGTITQGGTREAPIALNYGWVDAPINLWTRMRMRDNPTGVLRVYPEKLVGDFCRQAPYDRNILPIIEYYAANVGYHNLTERWKYTVPTDRIYQSSIMTSMIRTNRVHATNEISMYHNLNGDRILSLLHWRMLTPVEDKVFSLVFYMVAGDWINLKTRNYDSVNHSFYATMTGLEFDV